ncbi:MAG: VWA domain-containing protein [Pseudomonadota bacterium]
MERPITQFIDALRMADVRISPAETLDAFEAVELVGYDDRALLKDTLRLVLPKTLDEKLAFDACFDAYFAPPDLDTANDGADAADTTGRDDTGGETTAGTGAGDGEGAQPGEGESEPGNGATAPAAAAGDAADAADRSAKSGDGAVEVRSTLGRLIIDNDRAELNARLVEAANAVGLSDIKVFTQKGLYTRRIMDAMGQPALQDDLRRLEDNGGTDGHRLANRLRLGRDRLREQVRDYVEQQFLLHADADGMKLREEMLRKVKLSNVDQRNFKLISTVVERMAKKLIALHSRRRRVTKRGQLHIQRTLRHNMSYDGAIFDLRWKSTKVDRPKVFAICDVSGSVAAYARFMLMFLYSLEAVMPKVRSFAFSSELAEVTALFEQEDLETALNRTLAEHGGGSTDYGQALADFKRLALDDVDNRSTIIILGDGRNNYGDARAELLRELYERAKRVLWLNPESPRSWNLGDAEMRKYGTYCHQVAECNSLLHLERVVGNLLKTV